MFLSCQHLKIQFALARRHMKDFAFTPVVSQGQLVHILVELPLPRFEFAHHVTGHVKKTGEFTLACRTGELQLDLSLRVLAASVNTRSCAATLRANDEQLQSNPRRQLNPEEPSHQ